jgi:hypothetical protein
MFANCATEQRNGSYSNIKSQCARSKNENEEAAQTSQSARCEMHYKLSAMPITKVAF